MKIKNNRLNKRKVLILSLVVMLVMLISFSAYVGVGNHNDYNSNPDSGSSSGDNGSDFSDLLFILIFSSLPWPLKLVLLIVIGVSGFKFKNSLGNTNSNNSGGGGIKFTKSSNNTTSNGSSGMIAKDNTKEIEMAIKENDPNFSSGKFLGWTEQVFMTIQQAWTARDWSKVRPFEKEELYRTHELQLQEYINNGTINILERININQTYLHNYKRDSEFEYLTVYLQSRMNDYVIDEDTREVVRGNKDREFHTKYLMTFARKTGVLTNPATSNMSTLELLPPTLNT